MTAGGHSHYFDPDPDTAHQHFLVEAEWEGLVFQFRTDSSVFSRHRLDPGTDLLVKTVLGELRDRQASLLDLGTGVGVMAIALAKLRPRLTVTGSDVNRRALELAADNARRASVSGRVRFVEWDGVPEGIFDLVLTNPPIRAGKETVYRIFQEAAESLTPEGSLYLVIRVKQGAASAKRELGSYFGQVVTLARAKGYHVLKASQPGKRAEK